MKGGVAGGYVSRLCNRQSFLELCLRSPPQPGLKREQQTRPNSSLSDMHYHRVYLHSFTNRGRWRVCIGNEIVIDDVIYSTPDSPPLVPRGTPMPLPRSNSCRQGNMSRIQHRVSPHSFGLGSHEETRLLPQKTWPRN